MCNTGFVVVPRTLTQSAYSCLAATAVLSVAASQICTWNARIWCALRSRVLPVSSVVVETDIGSFIINTVTLACISLDSSVGRALAS